MKKQCNINIILRIIFIPLLLSGCLKNHYDIVPKLEGVPAGGMTGVEVKNIVGNIATLEMTLFVVDHFGGFISGLEKSNFKVTQAPYNSTMTFSNVVENELNEKGPYSATLLFDQSGSIAGTDPEDARIEAGVSFANLIGGGDEASITAFASGGYFQSPYENLVNFTTDKNQLIAAIESLQGRTNGSTPLYHSIFEMITYTKDGGKNENKAIVAFTDGQDTQAGVTTESIIQKACANGVQIYTVGLGDGVNIDVLSKIAFETGGAVMLAEDAIQLVALYNSLGDLLHGQAIVYQVQFQAALSPGNSWQIGDVISGIISLPLSELISIDFPFNVTIETEHLGAWYERLPPCPCKYEDAQKLAESECHDGTWKDCGDASQVFHYGAAYEVRWLPDEEGNIPGQQCTYDTSKMLITSGIAAGSPDKVSPRSCGDNIPDWVIDLYTEFVCVDEHCKQDVKPWETDPCYEYLQNWPANNANGCLPDNPVTDIQHLLALVGEMTCEQITILFIAIDENLNENHDLRKFFHQQLSFYPTNQIIGDLNMLSNALGCGGLFDPDECDVIQMAIDNLQ